MVPSQIGHKFMMYFKGIINDKREFGIPSPNFQDFKLESHQENWEKDFAPAVMLWL